MQWLAALCVRRPVFAWVLVLSLTVVGLFAFGRLGVDRFPNIDIPTISVTTRLPGAAPEQIETEVTDKIEEAVNTISGIDTLSSTSSEGISQVVVSFKLEKDADIAAQEVRDRVNRVLPQLPRTVLQPTVEKLDFHGVARDHRGGDRRQAGPRHHRVRRQGAAPAPRKLRRRRPGRGDRRPQAPDQPVARRGAAARAEAVGQRRRPRAAVAERRHPRRPHGSGRAVGDAAHARPDRDASTASATSCCAKSTATRSGCATSRGSKTAWPSPRTQASVNGDADGAAADPQAVGHQHRRGRQQRQAAARRARRPILPPGYQLRIVRDEAQFIEASIASVQEHLIVGSILAAIVVWLFLGNFRSTMIAAIAIPTSIIATFALIWYMGFTLNMLTMLALTLSVGIVIDDAIVVLENIYRFIEEKGMPPMEAAVEATKEIGLAVMATTLLAGRDLRAGRLHERHGRPLHAELRPDDGLRRAGVAVCQLHADADDVGATG